MMNKDRLDHVLARIKTDPGLSIFYNWLQDRRDRYHAIWDANNECPAQLQGQAHEVVEIIKEIDAAVERGRPPQQQG
jgi:hypothetical protein